MSAGWNICRWSWEARCQRPASAGARRGVGDHRSTWTWSFPPSASSRISVSWKRSRTRKTSPSPAGTPSTTTRKPCSAACPTCLPAATSATGPSLVVTAIGGGRRAARSIHQYLTGEEIKSSPKSLRKRHIPESLFETVPGVVESPRTPMPELPVAERIDSMIEVDQVITESDAKTRIQPVPQLLPHLLRPGRYRSKGSERRLTFSKPQQSSRGRPRGLPLSHHQAYVLRTRRFPLVV
jgi:hypothetical protein